MQTTNIATAIIVCLTSLTFVPIIIWALKRKTPMHFWAGTTIKPEEISDIPAYNRANALMWAAYAIGFFASGIVALFSVIACVVVIFVLCFPGIFGLIIAHSMIYRRYKAHKNIAEE